MKIVSGSLSPQTEIVGNVIRIVVCGDTHEHHREVDVPYGNLLIYTGDFTMFSRSLASIRDFNDWMLRQPHPHKVMIPGNHDYRLVDPEWRRLITGAVLLVDAGVRLAGLSIWGSPTTPCDGGAFGALTQHDRTQMYSRILDGVDILVTHGPPFGVLDMPHIGGNPQGCRQLLTAIRRVKPRIHAFGHIHGAYGTIRIGKTLHVNAALSGPDYAPTKVPISLDLVVASRKV
jgi:Icc-related predicted phosphoesterase